MKQSLIISAIILILGAILAWPNHQKLSAAQDNQAKLVRETAALDKTNDLEQSKINTSNSRNRERAESAEDGKSLAREYIEIMKLLNGDKNPDKPNDTYSRKRHDEIESRVAKLDVSQIKLFLAEFCAISDFSQSYRNAMTDDLISSFAKKYPTEMVDFLLQSPHVLNHESYKINSGIWSIIQVCSNEMKDQATAFQCLAKLEPTLQSKLIPAIVNSSDDPQKRTDILVAMRDYATTEERLEIAKNSMSKLAFGDGRGFDEVSSWFASAKLSVEELSDATKGLQKNVKVVETRQWLDWLAKSELPHATSKEHAFQLASKWTEADYQAVGQWLNSSPDSPEKSAVAGAYAAKAYPYDPQNAMKWIQTLPQGPDRTKALETIYQSMPKDSDTAKAFASEHGLNR